MNANENNLKQQTGTVQPSSESDGSPPTPASIASLLSSRPPNAKVAVAFLDRDTDAVLLVSVNRILDAMAGNAVYPAPQPTPEVVGAIRDAYADALAASKDRSHIAILQRRQARTALVRQMRELALYVQRVSGGDPVKLASSGFPAQRGRGGSVGTLAAPQNVRLRKSRLGDQLLARCDRVRSAVAYQWRYATAATPPAWTTSDPVTTASFTFDGLTEGVQYIAQARACGASGPSDWSDAAGMMAG